MTSKRRYISKKGKTRLQGRAYLSLTSCGDFLLHLFSHGNRATAAATSQQSSQEDIRRGEEEKEETSGEETTTSSSHLGSQYSTKIGALQHDYYHYDQCTSCEDISEDGDILATCLHLYDVDIKDGSCYMLNLPQPRPPTVFDGTSPTFPERACELRAYLNIGQFDYIEFFDHAYDAEEPLTTDITVLRTEAGARQCAEILRLRAHHQELRDERALPPADRRDLGVIDGEIQQDTNDLDAQQRLQDATTTVRRAGELFGHLIMHATKPGSKPNNLLRRLQRTNIGWETFRQLRHQYAAGARVQQYALLQGSVHPQPRWTETSPQQQFQRWIQDISAYERIHPVIDDALKVSTAINNLHGPIQQHLLLQVHIIHGKKYVR